MIYFDNAATGGFKPDSVITAATSAMKYSANPGRSGHKLSIACLEQVYNARKLLCGFLGGYSYDRTIFTKNCTEALNIALLGVLKAGDEVVTTVAEHNSVLRPLEHLKGRGVKVAYGPFRPFPVDMKASGIDALAVAGHKGMLAIQGSGALLFSERVNPSPVTFGGTGSESNNLNMPDFYPDGLESGTLSCPAIVSLGEGVLYLTANLAKNMEKTVRLTSFLCENLQKIAGIKLYSKPNPYGIVAFGSENMQSEIFAYRLSEEYSVCVRGGLHCAPLMHEALGTDGLVRASVSPFNTLNECETFIEAVRGLAN